MLAAQPATWLVRSWFDPGYDSFGEWIFLGVLGLMLWSVSSPRLGPVDVRAGRRALGLLAATAAVRVVGAWLALSTLGALALVFDVYALALGLGLHRRTKGLNPAGLALLFSLCLPAERLLQRGLGFPLQWLSSRAACTVLTPLHEGLQCSGTLISLKGHALSVDLPCSGAQGLLLITATFAALYALRRLAGLRALVAALALPALALAANTVRLVLLAEGLVRGWPVQQEPLHSLLGLVGLGLATWPLLAAARPAPAPPCGPVETTTPVVIRPAWGLLALGVAGLVTAVPAHPVDISPEVRPPGLPLSLGRRLAQSVPLSAQEARYFTRYGGAADKRTYDGLHTVVAVRTRAPLRHLHAPDECLIGSGHQVQLLGVRRFDLSSVYKSQAPDGQVWRVEVSYFGPDGARAQSPAEVAWRWLRSPGTSWTMIQRITPFELCASQPDVCRTFDRALWRALELENSHETSHDPDHWAGLGAAPDRDG